jgi:hypothetical protein
VNITKTISNPGEKNPTSYLSIGIPLMCLEHAHVKIDENKVFSSRREKRGVCGCNSFIINAVEYGTRSRGMSEKLPPLLGALLPVTIFRVVFQYKNLLRPERPGKIYLFTENLGWLWETMR